MAKYDVTYRCGHEATVQLFGKSSDREWKLDQMRLELCDECAYELKKKQIAEWSVEEGLPQLIGSEKQINWANEIRMDLINNFSSGRNHFLFLSAPVLRKDRDRIADEVLKLLTTETSAKWFIDHRIMNDDEWVRYINNKKADEVSAPPEDTRPILTPVNRTRPGVAEIKFVNDSFQHLLFCFNK